jgi:S-adenosylmethionine:tRNA ribosyltransferase-isomerase
VVRALEDSAAKHGAVVAGEAVADLRIDPETERRVTHGLFTGIHMPGESHYLLLRSFVDETTLDRATDIARENHYRMHEHGDACLIVTDDARRSDVAWA